MRPPASSDVVGVAAGHGEVPPALSGLAGTCASTVADGDLEPWDPDELSATVERCWATLARLRDLARQARGTGAS